MHLMLSTQQHYFNQTVNATETHTHTHTHTHYCSQRLARTYDTDFRSLHVRISLRNRLTAGAAVLCFDDTAFLVPRFSYWCHETEDLERLLLSIPVVVPVPFVQSVVITQLFLRILLSFQIENRLIHQAIRIRPQLLPLSHTTSDM